MSEILPNVFGLQDIFQQVYGYVPAKVPDLPVPQNQPNSAKVATNAPFKPITNKGSALYGLSDTMGREVFCPVSLIANNNLRFDLPYAVIGLRSRKIIKRTPLTERGGDVIEQIASGTWEISVKGFLIDPNNLFPDGDIDNLNQIYLQNQPLNLLCALSDMVLAVDDKVVMIDLEIPPKPKVIGVRDFAFTLVQDSVLDLIKVS